MNREFVMNLRTRVAAIRRSGWVNTISAVTMLLTPMVFFPTETVRWLTFLGMNVGLLAPLQIPFLMRAAVHYWKLARAFKPTSEPSPHFFSVMAINIDHLDGQAFGNYLLGLGGLIVSLMLGNSIASGIGGVLIGLAHMTLALFVLSGPRLRIAISLVNAEYAASTNGPEVASRPVPSRPVVFEEAYE